MTISIIICTRDRAQSLAPTLQSIGRVSVPENWTVELIVVDNGSTDATKTVVSEAALGRIDVRYLREDRVGQCYARNAGIEAALGEAILFTDDDVRVPSGWLEGMCQPILDGTADAVAGGVVFPGYIEQALAAGSLREKRGWLASTDGIDPGNPERMVGANMAFHRRIVDGGLRFDVELGPGALGFGDETLFSQRLVSGGSRLKARLDVAVEHHFDISRLTPGKMVDLARRFGRTRAYLFHHWEHHRSRLILFHLLRCYAQLLLVKWRPRDAAKEGVDPAERVLDLEERLAFCKAYLGYCWRPRKYFRTRSPEELFR